MAKDDLGLGDCVNRAVGAHLGSSPSIERAGQEGVADLECTLSLLRTEQLSEVELLALAARTRPRG